MSNTTLDLGRWYHVTFSLNETSRRGAVYVDGLPDRTAVFSAFTPQTVANAMFGRASWYNGAYLNMVIDQVRLYPAELSAHHVAADMANLP